MPTDDVIKTLDNSDIIYCLVYNDYRKDMSEYVRIKKVFTDSTYYGMSFLETVEVQEYRMFDSGVIPYVEYTGNKDDTIICDVLKLSPTAFRVLDNHHMSEGYERNIVSCNSGTIKNLVIYLAPTNMELSTFNKVRSGDWKTYSLVSGFD